MIDKIFNEDCLEGMKRIPDGAVDFVLTDLPFEITKCDWDKKIDLPQFWEQIKRVTKRGGAIALFAKMPFGAELIMSNRKMFRYEWIWEKNVAVGWFDANRMPLRCHENILIFYDKLPTYNPQFTEGKPYTRNHKTYPGGVYQSEGRVPTINDGKRYPRDVQHFASAISYSGKLLHNTQKPVDLLEYLIKTYTNEGELVLDATIGSGSTAVAAINTNRHFVGFETEKKFFDIAQERIKKALTERGQALFK